MLGRMPTGKKSKRVWLYLSEDDQERLHKLVQALGSLNEAAILSTLAGAGLKACEEIGNRMPLPLKFQVIEAAPVLGAAPSKVRH